MLVKQADLAGPGIGNYEDVEKIFPQLKTEKYPDLPDELTFLHAEDIFEMYPDPPRKQRGTKVI